MEALVTPLDFHAATARNRAKNVRLLGGFSRVFAPRRSEYMGINH